MIDRDGEILARLGVKTTLILPKGGRCFTADGKQATVKYDSSKKMFYIEWSGEEIPTTTRIVTKQNKVAIFFVYYKESQ